MATWDAIKRQIRLPMGDTNRTLCDVCREIVIDLLFECSTSLEVLRALYRIISLQSLESGIFK